MPLVCLLLVLLPFYRLLTVPVGGVFVSAVDALTMAAGVYVGGAFLLGHRLAWPRGRFGLVLAIYAFAVAASVVDAFDRGRAMHVLFALGLNVVLFVVLFQALRSPRRLRVFTDAYCLAGCVVAAIVFVQVMALLGVGAIRSVAGTFGERNEMVYVVLPAFALSLANAFTRGPRRFLHVLSALVLLAAIVASRGRAGLAIAGVLIVATPFVVRRHRGLRALEPLVIGALLVAAAVFVIGTGSSDLLERYTTSLQYEWTEQRGSTWARFEVLRGALHAFESRPIFGIGAENFRITSGYFVESSAERNLGNLADIQPHSTYVGALAETGLVGFVGLLGIVLTGLLGFRHLRRVAPEDRPVLAGVWLAFAAVAGYLVVFDAGVRPTTWIFLAAALAAREVAPRPHTRPLALRVRE